MITTEFTSICDSILFEDSSLQKIIGKLPHGQEIIKHLHQNTELPHNAEMKPVDKVLWNDIKNMTGWIILVGNRGVAGVRYYLSTDKYEIVTVNATGQNQFSDGKGGNILDFAKRQIGNIQKIYVSQTGTNTKTLKAKRNRSRTNPTSGQFIKKTTSDEKIDDQILRKLIPYIVKYIEKAEADIKGVINNMLKNKNLNGAKRKLEQLENLERLFDYIDNNQPLDKIDERQPGIRYIRNKLDIALFRAYGYFNPDGITHDGRKLKIKDQNYGEYKQFIDDASKGDLKKISPILSCLKQEILR